MLLTACIFSLIRLRLTINNKNIHYCMPILVSDPVTSQAAYLT